MSLGDVRSARSSPAPEACPECDTSASVTSDLHKYQVACTCKPSSAQYACADEPGPAPPAKADTPPALPPRPPASLLAATNRRTNASVGCNGGGASCRRRKYAWWCVGCGALAAALGGLLAAQHILLRAYTASPQHLETVPAAVPAAMLVLTGVCIMSLARRRNRYSYMIKVVGACCLVCALTCVLVTITTTVIHMNKLQTLKFCEYTKLTRTCTCYSMPPDTPHSAPDDEGVRCVFEGVSECGVVHGALYWCLRGVFALSVSAVLVCIFSCMLAYQLLSHERKKMYWEQLELRCRSLYRPAPGQAPPSAGRPVQSNCSCCAQCHPGPPAWDISLQHRFWAPGRIGNLYSPNPGAGRKTSAWSWFPWPRTNSQNSRCRMGGASGDSAYGFCEGESGPPAGYDERYPHAQHAQHAQHVSHASHAQHAPPQQHAQHMQGVNFQRVHPDGSFAHSSGFGQGQGSFSQGHPNFPQTQAGYPEGGSFDAATGVWGPPPPYSPHGRNNTRSHHHQGADPAAATLLQHPHHQHLPHCYLPDTRHTDITRINPELAEFTRLNPDISRINPELAEFARLNPDISRLNPELAEFARLNPDLSRLNPDLGHMSTMYPDVEMSHLTPEARFNTLRGHLVPYRCQRSLGMSAGNLHRDCRADDVAIECLHQKTASKVSEASSDSCQKQGKENLGFQNDKHSPIRALAGLGAGPAESEVYFADVSSCCNVSLKAECCMNANVSALVGTIENQPESTSESDSGLPPPGGRTPRAPPSTKRRARDKPRHHNTDHQLIHLNNMRLNDSRDRLNDRMNETRMSERMNDRISERMNETRMSERMNDRISDRMNETRLSERMNDSRDRLNEGRVCERIERLNDSRISDRMNETRMSERMNDSRERMAERMNDSRERMSDRMNDSRDRMNDSRSCEGMGDPRIERINDSRISDRMNETRLSERMNDSRVCERMNDSRLERMNDSKLSDRSDTRHGDRLNDARIERMSDLNSSIRIDGSPKMRTHISPLRIARSSPKNLTKDHPRQSSSDSSKPDFRQISPLSPNTEESLLSDDDRPDQVYSNDPESSKCLGPDSQYEPVREGKEEVLKGNHHHCYSDTNTMDSGWQSGSEKQVTD
ncbi:unnamed protein product [Chrysodeixis includens]|uniref:Uncharacterized protein n=1 Tax=Chrysodeixis includens TaxID=689277 RepID=A0A9P0FU96_CHRIL|nr:unnamed protein product [Chrysodeixis includens]